MHWITGAKTTRRAVNRICIYGSVGFDSVAAAGLPLVRIEYELRDGERGQRRQIMRIQNLDQSVSDLRQIIIKLAPDACREEREALKQPLYMRILATTRLWDEWPAH